MRGIAVKAFARGMNVVRLNQRNCGDTEHLSAGLFHSGLTADAEARDRGAHRRRRPAVDRRGRLFARRQPRAEARRRVRRDAPPELRAVAAVSPILEISQCVHALERPGNWLYQWNFVRDLKRRMRRKGRLRPGRFDLSRLAADPTVREFDDVYTAPHFGFADAEDYYHRASAMRVIDRIRVPPSSSPPRTIRSSRRSRSAIRGDRQPVHFAAHLQHGGHCGFVGQRMAETMTATGRRTRSWTSSHELRGWRVLRPGFSLAAPLAPRCADPSASCAEALDQQRRELRPFPLFLVLEIHETSRQPVVSRPMVSAQRSMSSGV